MPREAPRAATLALVLVAACTSGEMAAPAADAGAPAVDATATDAAGSADASFVDGGAHPDAAPVDASPGDGGLGDGGAPACARPSPFDEGVSYERTLHVAPGGTGDGSPERPFGAVAAAARAATPGTRILVAAGRYGAVSLPSLRGEPARPIAIVGEGEVIIDGGSGTGLRMSDGAYVVLQGLSLTGAVHGMNLDDGGSDSPSHHLVLRDLTIARAGSGGNNDCIKLSGIDDFWILGSRVGGCDRGELIDMVGCHRGMIAENTFRAPVANGVQAKGGSSDVLITANRFEAIPGRAVNAGGSTGLEFFRPIDAPHEAARIHVIANVFDDVGAMSGAPIAFVGCDACVFAHNTVLFPKTWVARILQETMDARFVPARDGVFANNIFVLRTSELRTFFNVGGGTAPETFRLERNLWYAVDQGPGWSGPSYGGGLPPERDAFVQLDPALIDRDAGDLRLAPESPARGAGRPLDFDLPPDFSGHCFADPPSLGAFEAEP